MYRIEIISRLWKQLKWIADDYLNNEKLDEVCEKVYLGCIDRLASSTSYTDDENCFKIGKCKAGVGGKICC